MQSLIVSVMRERYSLQSMSLYAQVSVGYMPLASGQVREKFSFHVQAQEHSTADIGNHDASPPGVASESCTVAVTPILLLEYMTASIILLRLIGEGMMPACAHAIVLLRVVVCAAAMEWSKRSQFLLTPNLCR